MGAKVPISLDVRTSASVFESCGGDRYKSCCLRMDAELKPKIFELKPV